MKKALLTLFCILTATIVYSQDFAAAEGKLIWQKVYECNMSYDEIYEALFNSGAVSDIGMANGVITCRIPNTSIDIKGAGYSRGNVPMYMVLNDITAFVTVQCKEDRYRVTIERMELISNTDTSLGKAGERIGIETYAIKRGELSKQLHNVIAPILGRQFNNIFSLKVKSYLDDNW